MPNPMCLTYTRGVKICTLSILSCILMWFVTGRFHAYQGLSWCCGLSAANTECSTPLTGVVAKLLPNLILLPVGFPSSDYIRWDRGTSATLIARFMGPTWGPSGADRSQVGPMLAPWTLLPGRLLPCSSTKTCGSDHCLVRLRSLAYR